ncbi:MAG: hypothetical protein ABIN01_17620 [Ferruginibacter sp.]
MDEHLLLHTLRIELMNGKVLFYNIDAYRKEELEEWLQARTNDLMEFSNNFLSFYAIPDRMVFVRISAIKRLIFLWDAAADVLSEPSQYHDNFEVAEIIDGELLLPAVIILLRSDPQPLIFSDLDPEGDFPGIGEESFSNDHFLKGGFISLPDEDGEQNYIPVTNIDCLEMARAFVYPDDTWEEMENMRRMEDNKN